jgi:hypothetical protein
MASVIQTKGINLGNGLLSSEKGRGGRDFLYTLYFMDPMSFVVLAHRRRFQKVLLRQIQPQMHSYAPLTLLHLGWPNQQILLFEHIFGGCRQKLSHSIHFRDLDWQLLVKSEFDL